MSRIGFIGLGRMGAGIAGRLLAAGHELLVYNRTPGKAEALVRAGAHLAASPSDALLAAGLGDQNESSVIEVARRAEPDPGRGSA